MTIPNIYREFVVISYQIVIFNNVVKETNNQKYLQEKFGSLPKQELENLQNNGNIQIMYEFTDLPVIYELRAVIAICEKNLI